MRLGHFWGAYGGHTGFDVRRRYANKSRLDGQVGSCRFVCSNEGHRRKGQTDHATKRFRAETRTNCQARMCFQLDREARNYEVTEVVLEHNHLLQLPHNRHLMISQRKISERHQKNHLRTKRQRELAFGQAGSMLKYFHDKTADNPSFQYALQLDCEEDITNIFWADAKMIQMCSKPMTFLVLQN